MLRAVRDIINFGPSSHMRERRRIRKNNASDQLRRERGLPTGPHAPPYQGTPAPKGG